MRFGALLGLSTLLVASMAISGCRSRYEWRQKLTVTIETPTGERSGSSVSEVVALFGQLPASGNEVEYEMKGEAAIVEVAPDRYLFALLDNGSKELVAAAWKNELPQLRREWLPRINKLSGNKEVPPNRYPMLVTFDDNDNPKSVRKVTPDNFAASFGDGVKLKSITIAITNEATTSGKVEKVLAWLCSYINPYRRLSGNSGAISNNDLANNLGPGSFKIGPCQ